MGCLGRFIDSLTKKQEDRILTTPLVPYRDVSRLGGCILGVAFGAMERFHRLEKPLHATEEWLEVGRRGLADWGEKECVAERFNALCMRAGGYPGAARLRVGSWHEIFAGGDPDQLQLAGAFCAAGLIRERILRNRARRLATSMQEEVAA